MLPVQQMGAALFGNQFTEELPHDIDIEKDGVKKIQGKSEFIEWTNFASEIRINTIEKQYISLNVAIPHNHSAEMLVPPPNCQI